MVVFCIRLVIYLLQFFFIFFCYQALPAFYCKNELQIDL